MENEFNYNPKWDKKVQAVVKFILNDEEWFVNYDDWVVAEAEERKYPIIYKDKLLLVDLETFDDLKKLNIWLNDRRLD